MHLKRHKNFLIEKSSNEPLIYNGNFCVTNDMILNGKLIKNYIPDQVNGNFDCSELELTTLEGCPTKVGGIFYCYDNHLISLKGCPKEVGGRFNCSNNNLTSLKGSPKEVGESFFCEHNQLTSLEGGPSKVGKFFGCEYNNLTSLEHAPIDIESEIDFDNNLVDLEIEASFIMSGKYINQKTYWPDLLQYMLDQEIDLNKVHGWPDEFIETLDDQYKNLLYSSKKLRKFNL